MWLMSVWFSPMSHCTGQSYHSTHTLNYFYSPHCSQMGHSVSFMGQCVHTQASRNFPFYFSDIKNESMNFFLMVTFCLGNEFRWPHYSRRKLCYKMFCCEIYVAQQFPLRVRSFEICSLEFNGLY
jgi:hypothetical protein